MNRDPKTMDQIAVTRATDFAIGKNETIIKRALEISTDHKKNERRLASMCKSCFYAGPRIGGRAMTSQPCGICGEDQRYSSTSTDVLCEKCAKANLLCKRCGADVELRLTRRFLEDK